MTDRRCPYGVHWVVGGREHSDWFITRALANSRRSELMQAAERAGHLVEVLLKVYAKCIDGQRATINGRIDGVLD